MLFLVQLLKKTDGTFNKGTSEYAEEKACYSALYTAMSSAMNKADTQRIVCLIIDEGGAVRKREVYEVATEEVAE